MQNLSLWILRSFLFLLGLFVALFFIVPGSVLEIYVPNYIYFILILALPVLIDLFFNKNMIKKYFYWSVFIILVFISLKFILEYWFNNSFNIMI